MQIAKFPKGAIIFREGDDSAEAYRLLSGEVEITVDTVAGAKPLARLSAGQIFGEMSLIDDKPRSATATVLDDCELEVIHEENFNARVIGDPDNLLVYLTTLFDRIRATDALLQWHLNKSTPGHAKPSMEAALRGPAAEQPATAAPSGPARLRLISAADLGSGTDLTITRIPFRIGRLTLGGHGLTPLAPNDLSVPDEKPYHVSRNHCVIERSGSNFLVRDLGSRLGTIVNGSPLGIPFDSFVAPLKVGENTLVLGAEEGPHHFRIAVQ